MCVQCQEAGSSHGRARPKAKVDTVKAYIDYDLNMATVIHNDSSLHTSVAYDVQGAD